MLFNLWSNVPDIIGERAHFQVKAQARNLYSNNSNNNDENNNNYKDNINDNNNKTMYIFLRSLASNLGTVEHQRFIIFLSSFLGLM